MLRLLPSLRCIWSQGPTIRTSVFAAHTARSTQATEPQAFPCFSPHCVRRRDPGSSHNRIIIGSAHDAVAGGVSIRAVHKPSVVYTSMRVSRRRGCVQAPKWSRMPARGGGTARFSLLGRLVLAKLGVPCKARTVRQPARTRITIHLTRFDRAEMLPEWAVDTYRKLRAELIPTHVNGEAHLG